jgi:ABC-2 type transport system permease protein
MNSLAFKNFLRSKLVAAGLLLVFAAGIASIIIGKQFLSRQQKAVEEVTAHQQQHIQRNVQYFPADMGLLLYYLRFALLNKPDKLAAVSIGQRDVNPSIQAVTIRGLEAQKYDTDLMNPANLLSGNLDLSFVIIYLFPLLIVSFMFNLLSEEKEGGTWRLVNAQSSSGLKFLLQKLGVWMVIVYTLLLSLLIAALLILSLPLNESFAAFASVSALYLAFWFALCFLVAALRRSSSFNALLLLACWLMLTVLLPAAVNSAIANKYPVPEALRTTVKQRDGYHEKWDQPKEATMEKFYAHYPQYRKYPLPQKSFSWLWYYAMQQMGDDESADDAAEMRTKLQLREEASRKVAAFIPSLHTQLQLNDLAGSSLQNHLQFLDSTTRFHEKLRLYFYPKIFEEAAVKGEDWNRFMPENFSAPVCVAWGRLLLPLLASIAVLGLASFLVFNRRGMCKQHY